jgi:GntR family transcriptional regulator
LAEETTRTLYNKVKDALVRKIESNEWPLNSKIPPERELCDILNVSRITVRQALHELELKGNLSRKQGRGTFVTAPKIEQRLLNLYGFSEEVKKMGFQPSSRIIDFHISPCSEKVAQKLNVEPGTQVYYLKRVRIANNEPIAIETSYIPCTLCPALSSEEVVEMGLYNVMRAKFNLFPDKAEDAIESVLISPDSASLLNIGKHTPCLSLERCTMAGDTVVEYCRGVFRGDRYKYSITLNYVGQNGHHIGL